MLLVALLVDVLGSHRQRGGAQLIGQFLFVECDARASKQRENSVLQARQRWHGEGCRCSARPLLTVVWREQGEELYKYRP